MKVVVAVACHRDEPAVGSTVADLSADMESLPQAQLVVCVNGPDPASSPAAVALAEVPGVQLRFLEQASKPAAWNLLRSEPADVTVFSDADVGVRRGSVPALVEALSAAPTAVLAAARQTPVPGRTFAARVGAIPFELDWGGVAGTLYAARTAWLPAMPDDVILDDAWLWAAAESLGEDAIVRVPDAVATFRTASSWRDLWRQRLRAEAGKRQLRSRGLKLAPAPTGGRPSIAMVRAYPLRDLPAVAALAAVKLGAASWSRFRQPGWGSAPTTKS